MAGRVVVLTQLDNASPLGKLSGMRVLRTLATPRTRGVTPTGVTEIDQRSEVEVPGKLRPILSDIGVRQLGTRRSQKINMSRAVGPYTRVVGSQDR